MKRNTNINVTLQQFLKITFMFISAIKRLFLSAPIGFPLAALFLIFLTVTESFRYLEDLSIYLSYNLRPVAFLIYTVLWIGCCYLQKWGAIGFILVTVFSMCFHFWAPQSIIKSALGDILISPLPITVFLSFLILFYYQKIDRRSRDRTLKLSENMPT